MPNGKRSSSRTPSRGRKRVRIEHQPTPGKSRHSSRSATPGSRSRSSGNRSASRASSAATALKEQDGFGGEIIGHTGGTESICKVHLKKAKISQKTLDRMSGRQTYMSDASGSFTSTTGRQLAVTTYQYLNFPDWGSLLGDMRSIKQVESY